MNTYPCQPLRWEGRADVKRVCHIQSHVWPREPSPTAVGEGRVRGLPVAGNGSSKTYLWCNSCRRSFSHADAHDGLCPVCSSPMREMSRLAALARGFMANELTASDLETKHR